MTAPDVSKPDLSTPEARDAYKRELRGVARPLRLVGLAFVVVAALIAILSRLGPAGLPAWIDIVFYSLLGIGWAILFTAIYQRTQYHRRRMAGR